MRNLIMDVKKESPKFNKNSIHPDVYSITHDLRAPLMSIKGMINLLRLDSSKDHLDNYLMFLEASVNKMDESISAIIDYSKSNEIEITKQEVDLFDAVNESLKTLQYMPEMEFLHVTIATQESGLFISDRKKLISFFSNIISNAVRYRDSAKKSFLHIDISFSKGNAIVVFKDNGIGIDKSLQSKVFDKLFRVTEDDKGSGLGLYILKKGIEILGGKIKLQSTLGEGSTFTMEIPNLLSSNLTVHCD